MDKPAMDKPENLLLIKGYGKDVHPDMWLRHEAEYAKTEGINVVLLDDIPCLAPGAPHLIAEFRSLIRLTFLREGLEPDKTTVLAHSLGGSGWLKCLEEIHSLRQCRTTLVATPSKELRIFGNFSEFALPNLDLTDDERSRILVVGSDNDLIVREHASELADHLGVNYIVIPGAGHFIPNAMRSRRSCERTPWLDLGPEWMDIRPQIAAGNLFY